MKRRGQEEKKEEMRVGIIVVFEFNIRSTHTEHTHTHTHMRPCIRAHIFFITSCVVWRDLCGVVYVSAPLWSITYTGLSQRLMTGQRAALFFFVFLDEAPLFFFFFHFRVPPEREWVKKKKKKKKKVCLGVSASVKSWMSENFLQLDDTKSEVIVFALIVWSDW